MSGDQILASAKLLWLSVDSFEQVDPRRACDEAVLAAGHKSIRWARWVQSAATRATYLNSFRTRKRGQSTEWFLHGTDGGSEQTNDFEFKLVDSDVTTIPATQFSIIYALAATVYVTYSSTSRMYRRHPKLLSLVP